IGRLKPGGPLVHVGTADRLLVPLRFSVAGCNPTPEFLRWHIEKMQLDADTEGSGCHPHLVTLDARPQPDVKDNAEALREDVLSVAPKQRLHALARYFIPRGSAERPEPLVLREADRGSLRRQLLCQGRLACARQPTHNYQSSISHGSGVALRPL